VRAASAKRAVLRHPGLNQVPLHARQQGLAVVPANTVNDWRNGAQFTDAVEHIRWRLWHGQTRRALCLIQGTLATLKAKAKGATASARSAARLAKALIALQTYVFGLADLIIDHASARMCRFQLNVRFRTQDH
jgi:hypothetical protein